MVPDDRLRLVTDPDPLQGLREDMRAILAALDAAKTAREEEAKDARRRWEDRAVRWIVGALIAAFFWGLSVELRTQGITSTRFTAEHGAQLREETRTRDTRIEGRLDGLSDRIRRLENGGGR